MSDQERLREAAGKLRGYAGDLNSEIDTLISDHPRSEEVWDGPAADDFYESREDARSRLETLADDLNDHADALESRADELDEEEDAEDGG
ncbi:hypothetical protein EF847_06270 [Actinobacteria bacterium YIM 96077]|uniref:WXG100 family type VII secretion target n=1 Tax=Phytoactinopolyspora halophila TaxID=1981511 RepID=A0A329QAX8_9ACTN|nr:WXG100 family type VII secretion target [Phytoactinopolyspora halophila]AYY12370.1 hypothetical protein EF847_06270 [Actinobacteria bacterium YIM 96077]RAW09221.1 hypothetical protein DPM12_22275 [Phytoactinopolyspora halophila]